MYLRSNPSLPHFQDRDDVGAGDHETTVQFMCVQEEVGDRRTASCAFRLESSVDGQCLSFSRKNAMRTLSSVSVGANADAGPQEVA